MKRAFEIEYPESFRGVLDDLKLSEIINRYFGPPSSLPFKVRETITDELLGKKPSEDVHYVHYSVPKDHVSRMISGAAQAVQTQVSHTFDPLEMAHEAIKKKNVGLNLILLQLREIMSGDCTP